MATAAQSTTSSLTIHTDAPEYLRCATHCGDILNRLRDRQDLCDVVLIVGNSGKRISAHRLILIASTDYFSALLSGGMRESQEREITLNEVHGDALEELVNYCYTGVLELRVDTIESLLITANYLQLKEITKGCCEFLQRHLQVPNCLSVAFLAEQLNLVELLHNAKKFICENFEKVSNHPEFILLTAKQLSEFIANDDLTVPSEEFVFRILIKWIEYEPENRRKHFTELLALVRLHQLSPYFLAEEVEPLCNTVESHNLFVNALKSCDLLLTSNSTQLRNYRSKSAAKHLLGIYTKNQNLAIAGYNLQAKVWTKWNAPIEIRHQFAAALMNDNLIMVGGSIGYTPINTVTSFNVRTMARTQMTPLGTSRWGHCVTILSGLLYAIGGLDERKVLNSVERWDPTSETWSTVAPMKTARFDSSVAVMDGQLYISGGYYREFLKSVECYDPVERTWRSKAPMKVARTSHCLVGLKGYLFAIGGCNYGCKEGGIPIERYDPRTDIWTTVLCTPAIYGFTRCASRGPDLFIINNCSIYTISSESSCDNLQLQILAGYIDILPNISSIEWVAIPHEFRPPGSWIKDRES